MKHIENTKFYKKIINLINVQKLLICTYIAILFIIFLDPNKVIWLGYHIKYEPQLICYDLPRCFRILSLDILNLTAFFFDQLSQLLKIKINNVYLIPHYSLAVVSLIYIFYTIRSKIPSITLFLFITSYIFLTIRIFKIPAFFIYDFFVIVYLFLIIKHFDSLKKNFFSLQSILLLIIGTTIFEYLGFMYAGTIILYNFFSHYFKNLYFQLKHLFLIIIPLSTFALFFLFLASDPEQYWAGTPGEKNILSLWFSYGQFNNVTDIIKSLIKYSYLLIFVTIYYLFVIKFKIKNLLNLLKKNEIKILLSLMLTFLFIVTVGRFSSGFSVEWQRQFLPFLFLSSMLSYYIIYQINLLKKK